jgi:hypothetical protein
VLYQLVGTVVVPQVLKHQLVKISAERLDLNTQITSLKFDPYVFSLLIEGLGVRDAENNNLIAFDSLYINTAPSRYLFAKSIDIQSFELEGLSVRIELDEQGQSNFQKVTDAWLASTERSEQPEQAEEIAEDATPPMAQIHNFRLQDAQLTFVDNQPTEIFELLLEDIQLELENLNTASSDSAGFDASLAFASGGELALEGALFLVPGLQVKADLKIEALSLALLQSYLAESTQLSLVEALIDLEATLSSSAENAFAYEGSFAVSDLDLQYDQQSLLSWSSLDLPKNSFSLADKSLAVSEVRFSDLFARIIIDEQGGTNIGQSLASNAAQGQQIEAGDNVAQESPAESIAEAPALSAPESESGFDISIGQILVDSSAMHFGDFSLPLPFVTDISDLAGSVSTISNTSTEPASLDLGGQVGEFGLVGISGSLRPLNPKDLTNFELDFENIDMVDLSPYLIKFAGRSVATGKLDVDLGYAIEAGQLQGSNNIVLRDFTLGESVDSPGATNLPIGLALALLKNSEGVIDIDLPVSGDLNDPQFSFGSIIQTAFTNLITNIVSSPFRLLGGLVGSDAPLDMVEFEAGSSELTPPQIEKLTKLATALSERPQLGLEIPQAYTPELDRPALQQTALDQNIAELQVEGSETGINQRIELLEQLHNQNYAISDLELIRQEHSIDEQFDQLAYANGLYRKLAEAQSIGETEFQSLAKNRAEAIQNNLLELDPLFADRVTITQGFEPSEPSSESRVSARLELKGI